MPADRVAACQASRRRIGSGDTSHAHERRVDIELTHGEDALGVHPRVAAQPDDVGVAGALALVDEPRADPPHQRVKPEQRLDDHVHRRGEIVATANVHDFVRENGLHLALVQMIGDASRPQQHRRPDPEHTRFE